MKNAEAVLEIPRIQLLPVLNSLSSRIRSALQGQLRSRS